MLRVTLLIVFLLTFFTACTLTIAEQNHDLEYCSTSTVLNNQANTQYYAPCLLGVIQQGKRFYLAKEKAQNYLYRLEAYQTLEGRLQLVPAQIDRHSANQENTWLFEHRHKKTDQVISRLRIIEHQCTVSNISFEVTVKFEHQGQSYQGCAHWLKN